jgi:hypothetical protein
LSRARSARLAPTDADGAVFEWPFERNGESRKIAGDG